MGFCSFIRSLCCGTPPPAPPPPAPIPPPGNRVYGFLWQAGLGVPPLVTAYPAGVALPAGIYVVFNHDLLDNMADPFGRAPGGPGPVFVAPGAPSAAMTVWVAQMQANPPVGQDVLFNNVTQAKLSDLTGFFTYTAQCLEIISHTAAGALLFQRINASPGAVMISPAGGGGNQTGSGVGYENTLSVMIRRYLTGQPMPGAQVTAMVDQRYPLLATTAARFVQFAADMNALPLYSLFLDQAAFLPLNYLNANFTYAGNPVTGQNLQDWLSPAGLPAFDTNLRGFDGTPPARNALGIFVREYFLLALAIILYDFVPPGAGNGAGVNFNTRNDGDNVLASPQFRPPAVGLAHELMHAMHYCLGTAPGVMINHVTTTAAELLFAGIGPFAGRAITENAVRAQWGTIPPPVLDPSNTWAAPALRTCYEPPLPTETAAGLRALLRCI